MVALERGLDVRVSLSCWSFLIFWLSPGVVRAWCRGRLRFSRLSRTKVNGVDALFCAYSDKRPATVLLQSRLHDEGIPPGRIVFFERGVMRPNTTTIANRSLDLSLLKRPGHREGSNNAGESPLIGARQAKCRFAAWVFVSRALWLMRLGPRPYNLRSIGYYVRKALGADRRKGAMLKEPRNIVAILLQLEDDAQFQAQQRFPDNESFIAWAATHIRQNRWAAGWDIVVVQHPLDQRQVRTAEMRVRGLDALNGATVKLAVTICSTAGFDLWRRGVPVVATRECFYTGLPGVMEARQFETRSTAPPVAPTKHEVAYWEREVMCRYNVRGDVFAYDRVSLAAMLDRLLAIGRSAI